MSKAFNLNTLKVKTAKAVLEESDFLSQQEIENGSIETEAETELRDYIGLEVTARKDTSLQTQLKLAQLGEMVSHSKQVDQVKIIEGMVQTLADSIEDWNITDGDVKLPVTIENLENLPFSLFQALNKVTTKALSQGRLDPNYARS